jgi:hypothetical protein
MGDVGTVVGIVPQRNGLINKKKPESKDSGFFVLVDLQTASKGV